MTSNGQGFSLDLLYKKVKLSDDLRGAQDLTEADVSELLDIKLLGDFDLDQFRHGLEEVRDELQDEMNALLMQTTAHPSARHRQNVEKGLEIARKVLEEHDFDEDDEIFVDVANLMLLLARVRIQRDVVPLVSRGLYGVQVSEAIKFWASNKDADLQEAAWQTELAGRPQILSRVLGGLVVVMGEQQHVGGTSLSGAGERVTDYLLKHEITANVTLVEIKTPQTRLLGSKYRNTYPISQELSGSVSQVLLQRSQLMKNYFAKHHGASERFEVDAARCVVIAGSSEAELQDSAMAAAFEMQRDALASRVRIITFDELYSQLSQFNQM